jgi:hypothetical protein
LSGITDVLIHGGAAAINGYVLKIGTKAAHAHEEAFAAVARDRDAGDALKRFGDIVGGKLADVFGINDIDDIGGAALFIERLRQRFDEVLGNRVGKDILRLALRGGISLAARTELDRFIADSEARLIRLRLDDKTRIAPTQEELNSLAESSAHPLVASVARRLLEECRSSGRATEVALQALRVLYAAMDPRSRKTP